MTPVISTTTSPRSAVGSSAEVTGLLGLFTAISLAGTLLWHTALVGWSLESLSIFSLATSALAYAFVARSAQRGFWAISSIFLLVAMCFHQGLLLYSAFAIPQPPIEGSAGRWFGTVSTNEAVVAATAALLTFGLVAGWCARRGTADDAAEAVQPRHDDVYRDPFGAIGFTILAVAVVGWFVIGLQRIGSLFVLSNYQSWRAATGGQQISIIYFSIGLGLVLTVASGSRKWRRRAVVAMAVFAIAALPIGLRGEVLFPAAAGAAVYARNGRTPRRLAAVVLIVILLTGINAVQQVRQVGLGGLDAAEISATPLQGVAELGSSLRTVDAVVRWHTTGGDESLRHGATYWAPFDRAIRGRVLNLPVPTGNADPLLMNVEMLNREAGIGGSFIAEAYRNFGLPGAVIIPGLIALLLGALDRRRSSIVTNAVVGVILNALLLHVRNSFAPVPFQILAGLVIVGLIAVAARALTQRTLRARPHSGRR